MGRRCCAGAGIGAGGGDGDEGIGESSSILMWPFCMLSWGWRIWNWKIIIIQYVVLSFQNALVIRRKTLSFRGKKNFE